MSTRLSTQLKRIKKQKKSTGNTTLNKNLASINVNAEENFIEAFDKKLLAKIGLYVMYVLFLFMFALAIGMAKATPPQSLVTLLPKPTAEEIEKKQAVKINQLILKALKEDDAVLVQCYNGKCYDVENNIQLNASANDGYYLVYPEGTKTKDKINSVSKQVKEISNKK